MAAFMRGAGRLSVAHDPVEAVVLLICDHWPVNGLYDQRSLSILPAPSMPPKTKSRSSFVSHTMPWPERLLRGALIDCGDSALSASGGNIVGVVCCVAVTVTCGVTVGATCFTSSVKLNWLNMPGSDWSRLPRMVNPAR